VQIRDFHADVWVVSNFFDCFRRGSLSFFHLFGDSFVSGTLQALMLNHHVESLAIRLLPQIIFDVFFFVDKLMLVKGIYGGVHFWRSLLQNPVDG